MRCFCLTNQISLHRHIKQADWTHHSQLLDILWFILETNQFIRKNNCQIDRKWNSSIREWVYCESSSYFQPEETTAVQGKMQIGWNTDCLMAGLVVYFTSLSDVTVCGSNKNTETVSLTANNDLHVLLDHGNSGKCFFLPHQVFVLTAGTITSSSVSIHLPALKFFSLSTWTICMYFCHTLTCSLIMRGQILDALINFVICLWLSLLSTDGSCNYVFCVHRLLQDGLTRPLT